MRLLSSRLFGKRWAIRKEIRLWDYKKVKRHRRSLQAVPHIVLVWTEAIAIGLFTLTFCGILLKVYFDKTDPKYCEESGVVWNAHIRDACVPCRSVWYDSLSNDSKGMLIVGIMGAIATIIYFLYDQDKEVDDHDESENTDEPF